MGLIDFMKEAGRKLFHGDKEKKKTAPPPNMAPGPDLDRHKAADIAEFIQDMGFDVTDLGVRVSGETATITGKVGTQEEREKVVLAVGNTAGIARVDDRLEVEKAEPEATFYTVKSGDTLSAIAKEHYGNASKYPVIFNANKPMLKDPDKIYPGQVLRIPPQS